MRSGFLNKLLERAGRLRPEELGRHLSELAREKGFFESIFNALQEGVIVADVGGRLTYINPAACAMLGIDAESSLGRPFSERVPAIAWEAVAAAETALTRDLEIFYPEHRVVNFYAVPLKLEHPAPEEKSGAAAARDELVLPGETAVQQLVGFAIILRDITETMRTTEQTIESERLTALTLLAAGVAHEIGNPLNSLHIHLQLLERRLKGLAPTDRERLEDPLGIAREEIKRLDLILTQFLAAIRPERLDLQPADVNALVSESIEFLRPEIHDRGLSVTQELHSGLPAIPLDRTQIKQAFYNLIKNACQAMGEGGVLTVRTDIEDSGTLVRVSFADTGHGMSAETLSRVFEPYFTTKSTGSGLGLLIVRRIVHGHGGELAIESSEGRGATVSVLLPSSDRRMRMLPAAAA